MWRATSTGLQDLWPALPSSLLQCLTTLLVEKFFPNIQPKLQLAHLEAISPCPLLFTWEKRLTLTTPQPPLRELYRVVKPLLLFSRLDTPNPSATPHRNALLWFRNSCREVFQRHSREVCADALWKSAETVIISVPCDQKNPPVLCLFLGLQSCALGVAQHHSKLTHKNKTHFSFKWKVHFLLWALVPQNVLYLPGHWCVSMWACIFLH